MIYRLVQQVEGRLIATDFNADNFIAAMSVRGFEFNGENRNRSNREELQGQPKFCGVCGPMWGGDEIGGAVIRYETVEAYRTLSQ